MSVDLPHGPDFFQFSDPGKLTEALLEIGFSEPGVNTVSQIWELTEPQGLFANIMQGAVRARALIAAQTPEVQQSILATLAEEVSIYKSSDGVYRVPMPALIGFAKKK